MTAGPAGCRTAPPCAWSRSLDLDEPWVTALDRADRRSEGWAAEVDALLAERAARAAARAEVALPTQMSVGQIVDLAAAPDRFGSDVVDDHGVV